MKLSTICLSVILMSTLAQGQSEQGESKMATKTQSTETKTKGIIVGLVYSNLTKVKSTTNDVVIINGVRTEENTNSNDDMHAGLVGLNVGYKNYYAWGPLGFDASATVFKGLNKSEVPSDMTFYKIQSNVVYPFTNNLSIAGGLNLGYMDLGKNDGLTVEPSLGGQIGLQADINSIGFMLGYQAVGSRYKYNNNSSSQSYTSSYDYLVSGMITQVTYTF